MPAPQRQAAPATLPSFASGKEGNNKLHSYQRLLRKRQRHISFRKPTAVAQRLCGHFPTRLAPSPSSPSGGRRYMSPHTHPLPQAGEGVQGAALVLPRTPAARLACFHIKIQISGGCLNGATKERSEFRRTSRLQGSPFLSPISFGDAKEMGSAVGPRPDSLPQTKHTAQTKSRKEREYKTHSCQRSRA